VARVFLTKHRIMKSTVLKLLLLALAMLTFAVQAAERSPNPQSPHRSAAPALDGKETGLGQLIEAHAQLEVLKQKYGDQHPMMIEQKAKIAALEKQLRNSGAPSGGLESAQRTFSIDFPGGSLRAFLTAIEKIDGVSLSIIGSGEQSDFETQLPPFSLKNTTLMTAVQVLSRLLQPRGFDLSPMSSDPSVVAVLSRHEPPRSTRIIPNEFESFQVGPYLADQTIEDIVAAIRTAWELDPQRDPNALRLKFHPATSILLVSGPRDGLNMAAKLISQLKTQSKTDARTAQERFQEIQEQARRNREARASEPPATGKK
jgi:hypothetical protein